MNPKIIYPIPGRQLYFYRSLRNTFRILFLLAALTCVIVNFCTGGKPWCLIVIWSLFSLWRLAFSLRLAEFSIFSHAARVSFYIVVLLILIDHFLVPGWAQTVVPIVLFGDMLIMSVLFFAIYDRKQRHLVSVLLLGLLNLAFIPYSLHSWPIENWIAFAFQCASFVLLAVLVLFNRRDLLYELKVRFMMHTK